MTYGQDVIFDYVTCDLDDVFVQGHENYCVKYHSDLNLALQLTDWKQ